MAVPFVRGHRTVSPRTPRNIYMYRRHPAQCHGSRTNSQKTECFGVLPVRNMSLSQTPSRGHSAGAHYQIRGHMTTSNIIYLPGYVALSISVRLRTH